MSFSPAAIYDRAIAPYVVHCGCSMGTFSRMRAAIVPRARGVVAEIGLGSALNLPHYPAGGVTRLVGIEPDGKMLGLARRKLARQPVPFDLIQTGAEDIPLKDSSVDTAIVTYALCTIPEPERALSEVRRILKPDGRLLFVEHGLSDRPRQARWQHRLNGAWGHIAGGCNLIREPSRMIAEAGFAVEDVRRERFPVHFWPLGAHFAGAAVPA